jgi:CBS domain-containing protein
MIRLSERINAAVASEIVTNRKLSALIKDQNPLTMTANQTVQHACRRMWERRVGAALVTGVNHALAGIFTGRDAVRAVAEGKDPATTPLVSLHCP